MVPHLDISLILLNSVYKGVWRWSPGELELQAMGFLLRTGIGPWVDVGSGAMRGQIRHPLPILPVAGVNAGVWF